MPWSNQVVLCPFYLEWQREKKKIKCEGVSKGTSIQLVFKGEKYGYMKRHCCGKYQECMIFKMLSDKYEKKEKQG